ncbi:HINT domain-containing protein [Paenibacillus sp. N3.4]|uniref:HINT domain-containing protein n=1 Tax=Paenibacillus sp. N3.4 TaxID=2603222 RepID=UPI0021C3A46B|nr:HINT domain-containing protein [Paenibacillus sp. N3.4]
MSNNPLRYTDPSGHEQIVEGTPGIGYMGEVYTPGFYQSATNGLVSGFQFAGSVVNFMVMDNINTIVDPNASTFNKSLAIAGFVPVGKVISGGKLVIKLVNGERQITRAVELSEDSWKAAANLACNCFVTGTKVQTDEGEKNIEDIDVGDRVLSKDEETGEVAYKEVTATFNHETDEIYMITVGDQVIESTFNHPFYVEGKGWTFVKDLKVGDLLVQSDGNTLKIESIELLHKHVTVYNMTVDRFHTYFVSDLGIWVHNTNCFSGSGADLANFARNSKSIDGLQGMTISADLINEAAINFVGKGAKIQKVDGGMLYTSKNGLSSVRTGQKYGKNVYEANFETFDSKGKQLTNYHVQIE